MNFTDFNIDVPGTAQGDVKTTCPECSGGRRKSKDRCLSVNVEDGIWKCHHCGWSGSLRERNIRREKQYRRPDPRPRLALPQNALDWFHNRGITDAVLSRNRIDYGHAYFPQGQAEAVIFPYLRGGQEVNRKYRTLDKTFRMEQGCEPVLYGLDDIRAEKPLVWCEGELDKLALEVAGFQCAVSVPNGAPSPNTKGPIKMPYLEADEERINSASRHVLAVDSDSPGQKLEQELARRLGPEKCFRVEWPEGCKDANDVLMKHGADELQWFVENAKPYPIEGVFSPSDRKADILRLYREGLERGARTGWASVDEFYTVRPGELTVVTGIPSSGKSNWLDCLLINLARLHGWNFALFSPENLPLEQHMSAMMEKYAGRPFHHPWAVRMTQAEFTDAMEWLEQRFSWIMPSDDKEWSIEKVLDSAAKLCFRHGIQGLVIDPYNELEPHRPPAMSETEYVSQFLKRVRIFARQRSIHVWVVVHPQKLYRGDGGKYPVPTLYDCAGSAHWRNKADNGIVVWRDLAGADTSEVQIHIQKIRFRAIGKRGMAKLQYDPVCAVYQEENSHEGA